MGTRSAGAERMGRFPGGGDGRWAVSGTPEPPRGTPEAKSVTAGHVTSGTSDDRRERFERLVGLPDGIQKESGLNRNVRACARPRHSLSEVTVDHYLNTSSDIFKNRTVSKPPK